MIRHKFKAKITTEDGIKFHSKKEAAYYRQLKMKKEAGIVLFFLRQVPFHLPGNVKVVVDFVEFHNDGEVKFIDVKGYRTKTYIKNKKMVEALYPVEIEER